MWALVSPCTNNIPAFQMQTGSAIKQKGTGVATSRLLTHSLPTNASLNCCWAWNTQQPAPNPETRMAQLLLGVEHSATGTKPKNTRAKGPP